ncbi:hypothetical protein BN440_0932 [Erwinia amylovora MR1]|nr:hypothetical protein BN440_0932 [Erwinia amylovora MR1]
MNWMISLSQPSEFVQKIIAIRQLNDPRTKAN